MKIFCGLSNLQSGGIRFGVGPLAHLLKNRFYIGEVHYRSEVYRGEYEPILSRDVFEAVQEKLAANAVERRVRLRGSAALLAGYLYDDRGNRMSPACKQEGRALPLLCLAGTFAESQIQSRQRRSRAGSGGREPRL
jgi:Recombinase